MSSSASRLTAALLAALLLTTACTSNSDGERAEEAEAQLAQAQADLATAQAEAAAAAARVAELESQLATAQATVSDTEATLTSTQGALESLRTESALLTETQAALGEQYEVLRSALSLLADAVCLGVNGEPPADLPASLTSWLKETQSSSGEVPDDLGVTIIDAAGRDGWWAFTAEFSSRFQPGVFLRDPNGGFQILWAGFASSEAELWTYLLEDGPEGSAELATCVDLAAFVDSGQSVDVAVEVTQDGLRVLVVDCLGRPLWRLSAGLSEQPRPFLTPETPVWELERDPGAPAQPAAGPEPLILTEGMPPSGMRETYYWFRPPLLFQPRYLIVDVGVSDLGSGRVVGPQSVFDIADLRPGFVALPLGSGSANLLRSMRLERFLRVESLRCMTFDG